MTQRQGASSEWFIEHIPLVSVQWNQVPAEVGAQSGNHPLHRFRTADEDPKFSMIYYGNDQFCGEGIYYLRRKLVLHCLSPAINQHQTEELT